jgi:TatD DNase family protein
MLIVKEENQGKLKGVFHCFSGDMELAKEALNLGFLISFTANITFPKADKVRSAAKDIPLDRLMIETDCPFLAPQIYRGKRNEPSYVVEVAKQIAEVKGIPVEDVAIETTKNARRLFKI